MDILMISGEESGDLHGSLLMRALREIDPGIRVMGMGGERMRAEGLEGIDSREVSVVGIAEVFEKVPSIINAFRRLKGFLRNRRFDCVVLIDFPDFNLLFAGEAKKRGVPVIYYISPQVWAWRRGRIKKIARLVDKMLVVFPFEVELYRASGVDVEYVGHPLVDIAVCEMTQREARRSLGIPEDSTVIALLPGSRKDEVRRLLPVMLDAGRLIQNRLKKGIHFVLSPADSIDDRFLSTFLKDTGLDVRVLRERMYELLRASDAAVVASGTATLETSLIGTPMVIVYMVSYISYLIGRLMIGVSHIGLPNIIAGRTVVPEFIQGEVTPENISKEIVDILVDPERRESISQGLEGIRSGLGRSGAPRRAAIAIYRTVKGSPPEGFLREGGLRSSENYRGVEA